MVLLVISQQVASEPPTAVLHCRGDILDKYAVMQVQYHNLTEQLWPLLKHYVVHPKVPFTSPTEP